MSSAINKIIALNNDWVIRRQIFVWDRTKNIDVPATGLLTVVGHISATPEGGPIHNVLSIQLAETGEGEGIYDGIISGVNIATYLAPYVNKYVYEVVAIPNEYRTFAKFAVKSSLPSD